MTRLKRIQQAVSLYLSEKEYRPIYHGLCVLAIIAAACFLFFRNFNHHGMLMATDMTWPDTYSRLQFKVVNTWFPYGSTPGTGMIQWFFWIYPSSMLARLLHISISRYMLSMFIGTFSLAGISMYALAFNTISKMKLRNLATYSPYMGAVFAGIVYMYNPWSIHYLRPYFAYPIYALMPLLFMAMVKTFDSPSARNIILFALFVTIANTSYNLTWLFGLIGSYLIFYLVTRRLRRDSLLSSAKVIFGTASVYLVVNALWVVPYLGAIAQGKPMLPFYSPQLTDTMLNGLSANNSLMNNLRLLSVWSWSIFKLPGSTYLQVLTFAIPILVLVSLIVVRREIRGNGTVIYWALVGTVALVTATGTSSFLRGFYDWLVFRAPGSGSLGWILRVPERFLFFVAPFFALMLGILVSRLLVKRPSGPTGAPTRHGIANYFHYTDEIHTDGRSQTQGQSPEEKIALFEYAARNRNYRTYLALSALVIGIVLVSMYPKALDFAQKVYNPANVPADYQKVNDFLSKKSAEPRVAWIPFYPPENFVYSWAPEKRISWYSIMTSKPGINSIHEVMNNDSYFNWLEGLFQKGVFPPKVSIQNPQLMISNDIMSRLYIPFSAKYIIKDNSVQGFDFGNRYSTDKSLEPDYHTRFLQLYKTDFDPGYLWAATRTLNARSFFDNLAIFQRLPGEGYKNLGFSDGPSFFGGAKKVDKNFGAVDLGPYLQQINTNGGFEIRYADGQFPYWSESFRNPSSTIKEDDRVKAEGKRSLRLENTARGTFQIASVFGNGIPVAQESICAIETRVKTRNSNWSQVVVEGYQKKTKKWIQLALVPTFQSGDTGWQQYYCSFKLPPGITQVRPRLGAGWVKNKWKGPAVSWFDGIKIYTVNDAILNDLMLKPAAPQITFTKINAEKYKVSVRGATAPFVLVQSESFDSLWSVKFKDGKRAYPVPMYSTINGFPIDKTGNFDLVLEYTPQKWFIYGLIVTLVSLLALSLYLLFKWRPKLPRPEVHIRSSLRQFGETVESFFEAPRRIKPTRTDPNLWRLQRQRALEER
jgi:hypothetical protein